MSADNIDDMEKMLAEMQAKQAELLSKIREAKESAKMSAPVKLEVGVFYGNESANVNFNFNPADYNNRQDIRTVLSRFYSFRRNYNNAAMNVTEWEKFVSEFTSLPNVAVEYVDKNAEKLIHDYLHSPLYSVEFKQNYFKVSTSPRARGKGNIFHALASVKFNHSTQSYEIAHSDSLPLWTTLEKYNNETAWDKASLEFVTKQLSQQAEADVVAQKRVSEKYLPGTFANTVYALKPYQTVSQEFADVSNDRLILADGMGLGKSPQAIFRAIDKNWFTIFIVPAGLIENWRREILKFSGGIEPLIFRGMREPHPIETIQTMQRSHKFVLIPMSTFGYNVDKENGDKVYPWAQFVDMVLPDLVVIDEGHYLSNTSAARGAAAQRINPKRVWVMTGTPLKNKVKDMIVMGKIVRPDLFPSIERAVDSFTTNNGKGVRNLEKLQDMFRSFMLRRVQSDVYSAEEMKEKHYYEKAYSLTESEKREYNDLVAGLQKEFDTVKGEVTESSIPNILVQFLRMKQLCSMAKVPDIVELANEIADSLDNHKYIPGENFPKIFIATQFVETAKAIKNDLGHRARLITGESHSPADRLREVDIITNAGEDIQFLVGTTKAFQEGLTMTAFGYLIQVDYEWTAAAHDQLEGRAFMRTNDPHGLEIYETIIPGSIEDHVRAIIANKRQLAAACVDGIQAARIRGNSIVSELIQRMKRDAYLK
jgi:SNF2 family DNA or RNA helicase